MNRPLELEVVVSGQQFVLVEVVIGAEVIMTGSEETTGIGEE